jgi:transcriptional regulator with GAF, ATPase, and Fis domain
VGGAQSVSVDVWVRAATNRDLTSAVAEGSTDVTPKVAVPTAPLVADVVEHEREVVEAALRESEGVIGGPTGAAVKVGVPRQTLESKIRTLGINRHRFKAS